MHRTVLITGATDGLGLGVAERAAAEGNRVILHGRNAERLTAAAERLEQKSVCVHPLCKATLRDSLTWSASWTR